MRTFQTVTLLLLLAATLLSGCAGTGKQVAGEPPLPDTGFKAVLVAPGDTLVSLAGEHLGDTGKAWMLAEFNGIQHPEPGQTLIVPLKPWTPGGLRPDGYQLVPILVYHHITPEARDKMSVPLADFEAQMQLLHDEGYHVISLAKLYKFMQLDSQIPQKSVVITFDDGWRSFYDLAMPVLKRFGYPATLFVYTDLIVGSSKTLSWDLVREIADTGFDIQCHSRTHRDLAKLHSGEDLPTYLKSLEEEIVTSSKILADKTGQIPRFMAYPYGTTNPLVTGVLRKHEFLGAFTVKRGGVPVFSDTLRINRSMVYGDFTMEQFREQLSVFKEEDVL